MARRAAKCWFTGIWLTILISVLAIARCAREEAEILTRKSTSTSGSGPERYEKELAKIRAARRTNILTAIKMLGDSITCSQVLGYPARFLGRDFNDSLVAAGGFTAGFVTCYQRYPW